MQQPPPSSQPFVLHYRRGPAWLEGKTVFEQPLAEHLAYVKQLIFAGTLALGGPFLDDSGGLLVVHADDTAAAQAIAEADPAIRAEIMVAEVHPWQLRAGRL